MPILSIKLISMCINMQHLNYIVSLSDIWRINSNIRLIYDIIKTKIGKTTVDTNVCLHYNCLRLMEKLPEGVPSLL